ncbi:hypothetical protein HAX54_037284 [Datura stramonium]|uniref:Uncharacterized protein n=1 Tax=Datura stramonium TaxID=4076 RepID=A0ABS8RGW1_DATST|nr:hypothetical protein [Datura stramonium]
MASNSMVPKKHFSQRDKKFSTISSHGHDIEDDFQVEIQEEDQEEDNKSSRSDQVISSQIYLKSTNSTGPMNKDVALRRIRHRKQVNKIKAATQSFLGFPFRISSNNIDTNNKILSDSHMIRWVDDAFAAP